MYKVVLIDEAGNVVFSIEITNQSEIENFFKIFFNHLLSKNNISTKLTEKEKIVAVYKLQRKTNQEIACLMGVSMKTIEYHYTNLLKKLQIDNLRFFTMFVEKQK